MLLALTSREDATSSFLLPLLKRQGVKFTRVDTDSLVAETSLSYRPGSPAIRLNGTWLEPDTITNVWYRRPERLKDPRFDNSPEGKYTLAEWTECVEGFFAHIPEERWVNHPARNALASHKIEQLTTARALGFRIPDTLLTHDPKALLSFQRTHGAIIAKPMANGYVERAGDQSDSLIYTNRIKPKDLADLSDLAACPTLFQECIDKSCDVRITVVDDDLHAIALFASGEGPDQRCDIRRDNMSAVHYEPVEVPPVIISKIRELMHHYKLRFGAIDMAICVTGEWCFFEINPNGQWAWLDMCAGSNISDSFVKSFANA